MPEETFAGPVPAHKQHGYGITAEDVPPRVSKWLTRMEATMDPDACWPWKENGDLNRYGAARMKPFLKAHRAVAALANGEVPAGMFVLHSCDHPGCCNPKHLIVGTHLDNVRDRDQKKRGWDGDSIAEMQRVRWRKRDGKQRLKFMAPLQAARRDPQKRRGVRDPEGRFWSTALAAAKNVGLTSGAIWHRCNRGTQGWAWAESEA